MKIYQGSKEEAALKQGRYRLQMLRYPFEKEIGTLTIDEDGEACMSGSARLVGNDMDQWGPLYKIIGEANPCT